MSAEDPNHGSPYGISKEELNQNTQSSKETTDKDLEKRQNILDLDKDNLKLIEKFGASPIDSVSETPDFYTFRNRLMFSHRNFDVFMKNLNNGVKSAIVSGFNASALPHIGHYSVFDTNLFFQRKYDVQVFIPISDDESYVSGKIKTQEQGLKNSLELARSIIAYGYEPEKTHLIIDQLYTNVYNLAIKISRNITLSEIKAVYGYGNDANVGLHFYPAIQSAHVLMPNLHGMSNVLVPIGPDEDAHLRVCRDVAEKIGYQKPAVLHSKFLPGVDGLKMSKSRGNAISFMDSDKVIRKKIFSAFSGGRTSIEEHRRLGGVPEVDISFLYLKSYFLNDKESNDLYQSYKSGELLSGDLKQMLFDKVTPRIHEFRERYEKVSIQDLKKAIMVNEDIDIEKLLKKMEIF